MTPVSTPSAALLHSALIFGMCAVGAFLLAWLAALFIEWRASEQKPLPRVTRAIADLDMWMRYVRRARYGTERGIEWSIDTMQHAGKHALMFLFPSSKHAFKKHNPLTGLERGPSSYFLLEISADAKGGAKGNTSKKRTSRRTAKNM